MITQNYASEPRIIDLLPPPYFSNTSILHFRLQTPDFDYGVCLSLTKYENAATGNYYKAYFDDKNVKIIFQQKPFWGLVDLKEDMVCYKKTPVTTMHNVLF